MHGSDDATNAKLLGPMEAMTEQLRQWQQKYAVFEKSSSFFFFFLDQ